MDVSKIKAKGPWVLIKPDPSVKMTSGGLYLPDGHLYERIGLHTGEVISVGEGYWAQDKETNKTKFRRPDVKVGEKVAYRGHLQSANKVGQDHCFIHITDLIGVLGNGVELSLSLPYDN